MLWGAFFSMGKEQNGRGSQYELYPETYSGIYEHGSNESTAVCKLDIYSYTCANVTPK